MSIEAMSHVLGLKVGDSTRKLLLVGIANHAAKDGTAAFRSVKVYAEYADCSTRTAQRHIKVLLEEGRLREGDQRLVAHYPHYSRPIVYDVAMSEEQRIQWSEAAKDGGGRRETFAAQGGARLAGRDVVVTLPVDLDGSAAPGDNLTPGYGEAPGQARPGDNLTPGPGDNLSRGPGDAGDTPLVTPMSPDPVTPMSPKPSFEPSLSRPEPLPLADASGGGDSDALFGRVDTGADDEVSTGEDAEPVPSFEDFYAAYPRHTGRAAAEKAWALLMRKGKDPRVIVAGARRFAADPNLPTGPDAQYVPHPSTWLNGGRWDDEPLPPRIRPANANRHVDPDDDGSSWVTAMNAGR